MPYNVRTKKMIVGTLLHHHNDSFLWWWGGLQINPTSQEKDSATALLKQCVYYKAYHDKKAIQEIINHIT
jgi:hypothetical protein